MFGDYFEDFIPVMYRHGDIRLNSRRDMIFLGKENLQLLARFWERHAAKREKNSETAARYEDRERAASDAREERFYAGELRRFAKEAESKPMIFSKPTFHVNDRITYFLENPDRFVSGKLSKISHYDEEAGTATFSLLVIDKLGAHTIEFEPEEFSLYKTEDFEYFRAHISFFETYLSYYAEHITECDKAQRILRAAAALSPRSDPPDAA